MFSDLSANWFAAQALAGVATLLIGLQLGRRSQSGAEIVLGLVAALSILWSLRRFGQDALVRLAPLELLIYTEGTLIVPFITLVAGTFIGVGERHRHGRLGWLLAAFAMTYLISNGMWMLAPVAQPDSSFALLPAREIPQSRPDTCVAASLATALGAPGIGVKTNEAEMATLAEVREGHGATMLRALHGAKLRLAGTRTQPKLITCAPAEAIALSSRERPSLVTLRTGLRGRHMVVLFGSERPGQVAYFNPASQLIGSGRWINHRPASDQLISFDEFARRFTGDVICFIDAKSPRSALRGGW